LPGSKKEKRMAEAVGGIEVKGRRAEEKSKEVRI